MKQFKVAIFDMDGTILNTIDDLTDSLNYALGQTGYRSDFKPELVKSFVGSGIYNEIKRCIAYQKGLSVEQLEAVGTDHDPADGLVSDEEVERVRVVLAPYYDAHCRIKTGPYDGILELIRALRERGVVTVVVSNKPDAAVQKLSEEIFPGLFDLSIGEQAGIKRKPAPDMTDFALSKLQISKDEAVYIGDSEIDLETAKNAGLPCLAAGWGFRGKDFLLKHGAETVVDTPAELLQFF